MTLFWFWQPFYIWEIKICDTTRVTGIPVFNFTVRYNAKLVDGKFQHISESDSMLLEIYKGVRATQLGERCNVPLLLAH
jgi:hypothetical protein